MIVALHIVSCLWYYSAKLDDFGPSTWVYRFGYLDADIFTSYVTCIYWAFATLTTVGYGEIYPFTTIEKCITMIWMICSLYFIAFTVSSLSTLSSITNTRVKSLSEMLSLIDEFIADSKLNSTLAHKLRHSIRNSNKISGFSWADKQSIFNELPKELRYKVALAMHRKAVRHISFFVDKDKVIISAIIPFLSPLYVTVNNYVYEQNSYADEMYFILKGSAEYVLNEEMVICTIFRSDYFGEIELIFDLPRKYSAKARRNLEMLSMSKKLLNSIKTNYVCVWDELKMIAIDRDFKNGLTIERLRYTNIFSFENSKQEDKRNKTQEFDLPEKMMFLFDSMANLEQRFRSFRYKIKQKIAYKRSLSDTDAYDQE
jgi:CRP-like cAMP-binding protein